MALEFHCRTKHSAFSAPVLFGRNSPGHGARHIRFHGRGAGARSAGMATHSFHPRFSARRESTGGGVDELALHAPGEAAPTPAPGLFLRDTTGEPHDGSHSHHPQQFGGHRFADRETGDSSYGKSGSASSLSFIDRFSRRVGRGLAERRTAATAGTDRSREAESQILLGRI